MLHKEPLLRNLLGAVEAPKPPGPADEALRSAVYACLFFFTCAAAAGVWFTKINTGGGNSESAEAFKKNVAAFSPLRFIQTSDDTGPKSVETNFKKIYLCAFLLAMLADWLQGPYVYVLYQSYGFSHADNGVLFIFGFGSSALLGTFVGGYADKYGRKKFTILYCLIYACSCMTKHFNSFFILCIGRVLAGIATSLLYSVFESWVVCETAQRGFSDSLLGEIFSTAIFGNSVVAISAGFIAQFAADLYDFQQLIPNFLYIGKYTSPFDLAAIVLGVCAYWVDSKWSENFGQPSMSSLERMERGEGTNTFSLSLKLNYSKP